ncbi:MAG: DUF624 domain-containing protein [Eubacteriales bacterium]|nr:DUF624 domain-containing protein [Eubacteriales bacterium]
MYIFSMDNPFFRFVGRCVDLVWINILTLVCAIPVFTAGAALTAMYRVLLNITLKQESGITKEFFRAFKENFKSATRVFLPVLLAFLILFSNAYMIRQGVLDGWGDLYIVVCVSIGIIAGLLAIFLQYYTSLLARYDASVKQTIQNAIRLMFACFPQSLCMVIILISPIALMLLSNYFMGFWFLYGISFPAYFIAMILGKIYTRVEGRDSEGTEPENAAEEENELGSDES